MLLVPRPIRQNLINSPVREYLFALVHLPQLSTGNTLTINNLRPGLGTDIQAVERFMRHIAQIPILQCGNYWTMLSGLVPKESLEGLLDNISAPTFIPDVRIGLLDAPNCGCENVINEVPKILEMPGNWKRNITCRHYCEHPVVRTFVNRPRVLILSIAPGTVTFDNIDIADCIEEGQDDAGDDTTYVHVGSIYKSQDFKPILEIFNQNPSWHHGWLRYSDDRVERSAEVKTLNVATWCFAVYLRRSSLKDLAKVRRRAKADMPMGRMMGEASSRYIGIRVERSKAANSTD